MRKAPIDDDFLDAEELLSKPSQLNSVEISIGPRIKERIAFQLGKYRDWFF